MANKPAYEKLEEKHQVELTPWRMYLVICIVGLMMIGILGYGFFKGNRMNKVYAPLIDAAMEIKLEATTAHLWFEEIISGDRHEDIKTVWKHHEQAEWYVQAMLEGGKNPEGTFVPLENAEMRRKIKNVQGKLKEFREIAQERIEAIETSGIGSDIDQQYDHVFRGFLKEADEVETKLQQIMAKDLNVFRYIQIFLIVISILLFSALGIFFWHFNNQRVKNLLSLREANKALRESETELRLITENTRDLISITALDMKVTFLYASPSYEKLLGYSPNELIGTSAMDFIHPEDKKKLLPLVKKYVFGKAKQLVTGKKEDIFEWIEYRLPQKSGGWRHMEAIANVIEKKVIFINRDVTDHIEAKEEKARLEAKLQRAKKMESMGLLAGGVAHDLNNVLSGIVSYPELILLDLPEDSKLRKPLEVIQKSGHRATAIVEDLLTVARGVATAKEPLNLNALVGDYLDSPEFTKLEQFHPTFTGKTNLDKDIFNIIGSPVHIIKVVMNLVSNASEAIEGSGNVTISTMNRYVDRPLRGYDDINIGEYAVLTVSDDGSGISSDDLERIFEPFYTKKVMGRSGTGLGLAVVWNIMQDHDGYININTSEKGTTFELYFPITRDEASDGGLSIPIEDYKGDGETILVVDDEENQRDISCKMLETLGYNTKAVSSGEEAVEYLKDNTADLILLDMIMDPGMNGRETYERVIKIHLKQKAVIVSGFSESDEVKAAQKLGAGRYIKKPFTLEKIGLAVKEELEKE